MSAMVLGERSEGRSSVRSSGGVPVLDESYNYLVRTTSAAEDRTTVLSASGLPQVGITLSSGGIAVCKNVDAVRRSDQRTLWDVTATFSSEVDERQGTQSVSGDPTEWVPIYETKFERLQEIMTEDADGDAIANSAGQPYETGIVRSRFIPIWEFYQFEPASVTDEQVLERNEVVNSAIFKGKDIHTLLCTVMSSVIGFYYGNRRRLTRYALRYNVKTWKHKRLDVGTVYLESGKLKPYLDDDKNVILGGLDGSGAKVAAGTKPAVREFDQYDELAFATFLRI
jgi:hypothetical protein